MGKAAKVTESFLVPLSVAATGGVVANQFPQNRKSNKKALKDMKKQGGELTPVIKSDLPYFNHEYAQKIANLVSKMDDDSADMFAYLVMHEVLQQDIERNQRTLQTHINEVVEKRLAEVKKATKSLVSKSDSQEDWDFASAVVEIEKAVKNPYEFGFYEFEESDFRRDPQTGRFMQKITHNPNARPLGPKAAKNLGIPTNKNYNKLTKKQQAQYQNEYMQVVNFLNAAQGIGGSDTDVRIRVFQDRSGLKNTPGGPQYYWRQINGAPKVGEDWDPTVGERVVAVEAVPKGGLSLGGAAFGLPESLAQRNRFDRVNALDNGGFKSFSDAWTKNDFNAANSNERLYHRVKTGSQLVMDNTTTGTATNTAARLGRAIGEHGSEAEKVFGPAARRTAYRYRGTEKTPDAEVARQYKIAIGRAGAPQISAEDRKRMIARQNRALTAEKQRKAKALQAEGRKEVDWQGIALSPDEIRSIRGNIERAFMEQVATNVSPEARGAGLVVLRDHLMDKERAPKKALYNLQLDAGVTPPSEGFLLDKDGNIVTQASGYGDDHYLPFNLKHLSKLRGGEYIRTRSVGGPTTEDIYTGLMAGAKQITVVSRSGTFVVEFEDDFKGKRRYNDKAARMVRRYEQLLDSVQSASVQRNTQVSPAVREFLTNQVKAEGYDRTEIREEVQNRIKQYKNEMAMTAGDEADFNLFFEEMSGDLPEDQQRALKAQMHNDWQAENEYVFRLNGWGYRDALGALQEQFPYYFKTRYEPTRERERFEPEIDSGYVEPGRNRPTKARAGLHGTSVHQGTKISASDTNYQRGKITRMKTSPEDITTENGTAKPAEEQDENKGAAIKAKVEERKATGQAVRSAVALHQAIKTAVDDDTLAKFKWLNTDEAEAENYLRDPKNMKNFEEFVKDYREKLRNNVDAKLFKDFDAAAGKIGRVPYDENLAFTKNAKPFVFKGEPYTAGAKDTVVKAEVAKLNRRTKPISVNKELGALSDAEISNEIDALIEAKDYLAGEEGEEARVEALKAAGYSGPAAARLAKKDRLAKHIEDVHRMRALNLNRTSRDSAADQVVVHNKEPQKATDGEVKDHVEKLEEQMNIYKRAADYYAKRGDRDTADDMSAAFATLEDLKNNPVATDENFKALMNQLTDSGAAAKAAEAMANWKTELS